MNLTIWQRCLRGGLWLATEFGRGLWYLGATYAVPPTPLFPSAPRRSPAGALNQDLNNQGPVNQGPINQGSRQRPDDRKPTRSLLETR